MTFHQFLDKAEDAASSAMVATQALVAVGHLPDDNGVKKGSAVSIALGILNPILESHGGQIFEPLVDSVVEKFIEGALAEAKEAASHLPGGFAGVVQGIITELQ